jgi:hypothetical protein
MRSAARQEAPIAMVLVSALAALQTMRTDQLFGCMTSTPKRQLPAPHCE